MDTPAAGLVDVSPQLGSPSALSCATPDIKDEVPSDVPANGARVTQRGTKNAAHKCRRPFSEERRLQTSRTRAVGACVRCRMQHIRCTPNPEDPDGYCEPCRRVRIDSSKKYFQNSPCERCRVVHMKPYRSRLAYTSRWDVTARDVPGSGPVRKIWLGTFYNRNGRQFDLYNKPFQLDVHEYTLEGGDREHRCWVRNGELQTVTLPPFALASCASTKQALEEYINNNCVAAFLQAARNAEPLAQVIFGATVNYYAELNQVNVSSINRHAVEPTKTSRQC